MKMKEGNAACEERRPVKSESWRGAWACDVKQPDLWRKWKPIQWKHWLLLTHCCASLTLRSSRDSQCGDLAKPSQLCHACPEHVWQKLASLAEKEETIDTMWRRNFEAWRRMTEKKIEANSWHGQAASLIFCRKENEENHIGDDWKACENCNDVAIMMTDWCPYCLASDL